MKRQLFASALLVLALLFFGLGLWQLERRTWKLELIAQVNARVHAQPRPVTAWSQVTDRDAYTPVRVSGVFLHDREALVQAVTEQGAGWWVMTPLQTSAGAVLVNRGFVPPGWRTAEARAMGNPSGPVTITGLVRRSEPGGGFLRANAPAADRWFSRDVAAIASARRLSNAAPFFIDADRSPNPGGYPIGGLTVLAFRNAHLAYALTWFALTGSCVLGAWVVLRSKAQS